MNEKRERKNPCMDGDQIRKEELSLKRILVIL
jgi:hypothetical protein